MIFDIIVFLLINVIGFKFVGKWFIVLEVIVLFIFLIWLWIKKYRPVIDNVSLFTGAPGTGKTKVMTDFAIYKYKVELRNVRLSNFFINIINKFFRRKIKFKEIPLLYSNYPIRIGRKKRKQYKNEYKLWSIDKKGLQPSKYLFSQVLTNDIILLQKRVPLRSVIAISEFSSIANNQDWANNYIKYNLDEWVRFIRQYSKGGWLFLDDQSSDLIVAQIRRRVGKVYNLQGLRKIPLLNIGIVKIRHLSISEDIKVVEEGQSESMKNTNWFPVFFYKKTYDTYAFSERIKNMSLDKSISFKQFKTNVIHKIPFSKGDDKNYKAPKTDDSI